MNEAGAVYVTTQARVHPKSVRPFIARRSRIRVRGAKPCGGVGSSLLLRSIALPCFRAQTNKRTEPKSVCPSGTRGSLIVFRCCYLVGFSP